MDPKAAIPFYEPRVEFEPDEEAEYILDLICCGGDLCDEFGNEIIKTLHDPKIER